jgi:hypothetical protein
MCATVRMVVKRKGAARPVALDGTLLPYDERFELGPSLAAASGAVPLNRPPLCKVLRARRGRVRPQLK